jgi:iron complex outermembrane recepter protein
MSILSSRSRLVGRFISACALAVPLLSLTVRAQASLEHEPTVQLDEIVVTARRVPEPTADVPAYIEVITRAQIRESAAANVIELLESEANLQFSSFSSSPTNAQVSLRGTGGSSAVGNGRTLVLLDGIRTNRADMGQFNWLQFNLQSIESIEVVQGPQGAFYGDNAVGGVIKINTLGAPTKSGGSAQALVGSDGTVKVAGGYTERLGAGWATLAGGRDSSDGYREHAGYQNTYASLGLGYDNAKDSVTRLNASYQTTTFDQPGYLSKAQLGEDPQQRGVSIGNGESDYRRLALSNVYGVSAQAKLLTDVGVSLANETFNGFADLPFATRYQRDLAGYFFAPKLRFSTEDFTFTPGVDVNLDQIDTVASTPAESTVKRRVVSPYLFSEWRFNERATLSAGYRHEWNNSEAVERVSGQTGERRDTASAAQIALNYKATEALRLYAKYDRAYRFPATDELAYYQGFASPVFFDETLKPETSDNAEVGANYNAGGWRAGASAYYLKTRDEIFFNGFPVNLNQNLPETRRVGAQGKVGYTTKHMSVRSQVDYVNAELVEAAGSVQTGPLRMVPTWRVTNTLRLMPTAAWTVTLTHRHLGRSYVDDFYATTTPDRVAAEDLFDGKITYRPSEHWSLYAGVNNVFDRTYVSYASTSFGTDSYYPGQGRFLYLGATVTY